MSGVGTAPRVSVVTISFNQAAYLERAIRSVVLQDYPDVEYIVVDPGSTDGSRDIIERYRGDLASVITESDDGPADGLNRGFARATGDVFGYLNADDVLLPGAISRAVEHLRNDPNVDVVYGDGYIVDADGIPIRRFRSSSFSLRRWVHGGVSVMQQATFFRAEAFRAVGGFNTRNRAIWDAELVLSLALAGKRFRHVREDWALFTHHASSISVSKHANEAVRVQIAAEQERLIRLGGGGLPGPRRQVNRAVARAEKWIRDPQGVALRLGEISGRRPQLDLPRALQPSTGDGNRSPKVALLSHAYIEPQIRKNVDALGELVDLRVYTPERWEVLVFDDVVFEDAPASPVAFRTYRPLRPFGSQYVLPTLSMGFRRWRPDVVHVEYDPWNLVFWQALLSRKLFARGARVVCHVKKNTYRRYPGLRGALKAFLARSGLRRVDLVLAASEQAAGIYRDEFDFDQGRIEVVSHLAVDLATFHPGNRDDGGALRVGYAGQLAAHKGVQDLIDAVAQARDFAALELHLLGRGPLAEGIESRSRRDSWLRVHPAAANIAVADFLRELDLFVMPARVLPDHEEHDGLALLEALASGLPCIGTRSGIIPEILGDGTGILVEPRDPHELAGVLVELAVDAPRRVMLGQRARLRAEEHYGLEIVARRKANLFARVCA